YDRLSFDFAVADQPHALRRRRRAPHRRVGHFLDPLEDETRLLPWLEDDERQHGHVDRPLQVADVVTRALGGDLIRLVRGRRGRRDEQLDQTLVPIADGSAVDVEDVAELDPAVGADGPHQQEIRFQLAVPHVRQAGPGGRRSEGGGGPHILDVFLLGDDAGELSLELDDVPADPLEHGRQRGGWLRGGRRHERHRGRRDGDDGAEAHYFFSGAIFSSVCT